MPAGSPTLHQADEVLLGFARALRAAGVSVTTDRERPVVATLLPATTWFLMSDHYAPARALIDRGVPVALATLAIVVFGAVVAAENLVYFARTGIWLYQIHVINNIAAITALIAVTVLELVVLAIVRIPQRSERI